MLEANETMEKLYIHSKCCNAHWELVIKEDGSCDLECEVCGKSIGRRVDIDIPKERLKCDLCGKWHTVSGKI